MDEKKTESRGTSTDKVQPSADTGGPNKRTLVLHTDGSSNPNYRVRNLEKAREAKKRKHDQSESILDSEKQNEITPKRQRVDDYSSEDDFDDPPFRIRNTKNNSRSVVRPVIESLCTTLIAAGVYTALSFGSGYVRRYSEGKLGTNDTTVRNKWLN